MIFSESLSFQLDSTETFRFLLIYLNHYPIENFIPTSTCSGTLYVRTGYFYMSFLLEVANLQYLETFFSFRIRLINYVIDACIILVQKFRNGANKPHPMTRPFKSCGSFPSKVPVPGYVIIQNNSIVCSLLFWAKSLYWMASMILFSYSKFKILFIFQRIYSQKNFFQFRK